MLFISNVLFIYSNKIDTVLHTCISNLICWFKNKSIYKLQDARKDAHCNSDDQTLYKVVQLILPMLKCCNWNFWSIHILKFWRPPFSKWLTTWSSQYNVGQLQVIPDFCAKFEWQSVPLKCRQAKKTLQRFCRSYIMNEHFWNLHLYILKFLRYKPKTASYHMFNFY